jgi:hypothetical protein
MFENHTSTVVTAAAGGNVVSLSSEQMRETIEQLRLVREFIYQELKDGVDYGTVQGCGDKPTLLQPGAQKICMFFNVYPDYEVERRDVGEAHVDYIVKTTLISRTTGLKVGSGVGSCSSLERKYRYRQQNRTCPKCGAETIRSSKAGGFFCGVRSGGCGASFAANDASVRNQQIGMIENVDVADAFNTILKIAKKRSFVDATLSLSCISEFFTQDLEERGPLGTTLSSPGKDQVHARAAKPDHHARQHAAPSTAAPPPYTPDPALNWLEHPHVIEYNRLFEQMIDQSGTRNSDREPACRSFIKNEWMKITRANTVEARPDRVPVDLFWTCIAEWQQLVQRAIGEKQSNAKPARRSSRQSLPKAA